MNFSLRSLGLQVLELAIHIDNVRGGSVALGGMPSATTFVAEGLGFIGLGPTLMRLTPRLS